MFKKRDFKIGDLVIVIDSLYSYNDYASNLNDLIGEVGVITDTDFNIAYEISFNGNYWWFPPSCIDHVNNYKKSKPKKIKPNKSLFVGRSLASLNLSKINNIIYEGLENPKYILSNSMDYNDLYLKSVIVTSTDYEKFLYQSYDGLCDEYCDCVNKEDLYIGVNFNNSVYYLPSCVLIDIEPDYSSKLISKTI